MRGRRSASRSIHHHHHRRPTPFGAATLQVLLKAAKVYGDEAKAAKLSGGCRPQASWRQRRGRRSGASARYCVVENVWARRPFDGHPSRRPFHVVECNTRHVHKRFSLKRRGR